MTKLVLVRHGEPDYSFLNQKNMTSAKQEWAFLSDRGIEQAIEVANDPKLWDGDIILSSPYTSALQTASIIAERNELKVQGEVGLHEWVSQKNYANFRAYARDYKKAMYEFSSQANVKNRGYESLEQVRLRTLQVLRNYLLYEKIIAVIHAGVIYSLTQEKVPFGGVIELSLNEDLNHKNKVLVKSIEEEW